MGYIGTGLALCIDTSIWYLSILVNGAYYRNVLLSQQLLPAIRQISGEFFILQQDSVPAHRARETISLLEREMPAFFSPDLWPPNSPDLNPVDYKICGTMQQRVYQTINPNHLVRLRQWKHLIMTSDLEARDIWSAITYLHCKPTSTTTTTTSIQQSFSRTTWESQNQKGKPFRILLEQEIMGYQWHQLDHMQIICTLLQTDNHTSTSPLSF